MDKLIDYHKALQKYYFDLSQRMSINNNKEIAYYVDKCLRKEINFLKEFENKGFLKFDDFIDKSILINIKNKVEQFIDSQTNLNPVRKSDDGYVVPIDTNNVSVEYINDLNNIETKTPTISIKDPLINIKELIPLVFHESVISKAAAYFNTLPMVTFVKVVKHFPNELQSSVNSWHFDGPPGSLGSPKTLKVIYYLDDIDTMEKGPFCYVEGSHIDRIEFSKRTFSDQEVTQYYNNDLIKPAYANLGDAVFVKGEIVHKAGKPSSHPRTVIIINYCIQEEYLDTPGNNFIIDKVKIKKEDVDLIKFKELADDLIKI